METGPILRAMLRNKIGAVLIAAQIAFTMTVIVNAWVLIEERIERADRPSGIVEDELFHIGARGYAEDFNGAASVKDDLTLLRETPGITDAVVTNAIPLSGSGWSNGLQLEAGDAEQDFPTAVYMVDEHGIDTLGVELIAGRNFLPGEVRDRPASASNWPDHVILSEALARQMWPDASPLEVVDRTVYINNHQPVTVIGVIARLQAPWTGWRDLEQSVLVPDRVGWQGVTYLVRTEPGERERMMPVIEEALARANPERIVHAPESMAETRRQGYLVDTGLATILAVIMALLVTITTLGIVGLASFSVSRRTKQIGTRRALGATRGDILRYFVVENFLITTGGLALGIVMTVGLNMALVSALSFPKIDFLYVIAGVGGLWLLGLMAVLGPARRAAAVPPAVATRTV